MQEDDQSPSRALYKRCPSQFLFLKIRHSDAFAVD
ncbi:MAG: hypothetical protein RLZZ553_915 [Verrucomicrobiota bacterium]